MDTPSDSTSAATAPAAPVLDAAAVLIPVPTSVSKGVGTFVVSEATSIAAPQNSPEGTALAEQLAGSLRAATGYPIAVTAGAPAGHSIALVLDAGTSTGDEGYDLQVTTSSVVIRAAHPAGLFYGVQTLRQLLPVSVEKATADGTPVAVGATHIVDSPRYAWRGAMLDVARHFFPAADVKKYIDEISLYKLNVLHLHLSDDQGWRIAIDSRPKLTEIGGASAVGGGAGGFFTKQDYKDIVAHAAERFVTIVPEIDLPGHTNAALSSYAELNCDGKARTPYTGIAVGFSSVCVDKEETYTFIDEVFGELVAMTPGPYLHIGGDEVQSLSHADYAAFITRVQGIVAKHGKTLVGWEEAVKGDLSAGSILQYWNVQSDYAEQLRDATARGIKLVLSPADRTYLDMKYDDDHELGLEWAGRVSVKKSYDWDPGGVIPGAAPDSVLGVEAPVWSETLVTFADVESMAFPRLPAVAEVGWSSAHRDWNNFRGRLAAQAARWDVLGVNYHRAPGVDWPKK
ncbi:MAG: beta-N-acetylhexosaminidase [Frankiales bacterium]|nr:beta-N-acetylhexosaminidase [Frankiales bacterium]